MWILQFLPDSFVIFITYALFALGLGLYIASKLVTWIPLISQYKLPLELVGVVVLVCGSYLAGGWSTESAWRERVREMQARVAAAESAARDATAELNRANLERSSAIQSRSSTVIQYIAREVSQADETCRIPASVVRAHNAAAKNEAIQ